jgi:hypothetical protein
MKCLYREHSNIFYIYISPCPAMKCYREGCGRIMLTPPLRRWREYFERAPRFGDDYPEEIKELAAKTASRSNPNSGF